MCSIIIDNLNICKMFDGSIKLFQNFSVNLARWNPDVCPQLCRFLGTPYFHSMVARSLASLSDISVIIDPETILLPDFISALSYAHKLDHDWLLVSSSRHVSYFPFHLDKDGKHWLGEDGKQIKTRKVGNRYLIQI